MCGAGFADLRVRDLRHTCATWLLLAGVPERVKDEIIGHASTSMGRRYAHVPREMLHDTIGRLLRRGGPIRVRVKAGSSSAA